MNKKIFLLAATFVAASLFQSHVWGRQKRPRRHLTKWQTIQQENRLQKWLKKAEEARRKKEYSAAIFTSTLFYGVAQEKNPDKKINLIKGIIRKGHAPMVTDLAEKLASILYFSCDRIAKEANREIETELTRTRKYVQDAFRKRTLGREIASAKRKIQEWEWKKPKRGIIRWGYEKKLNEWQERLKKLEEKKRQLESEQKKIEENILNDAMGRLNSSTYYQKATTRIIKIIETYNFALTSDKMGPGREILKEDIDYFANKTREVYHPKWKYRHPELKLKIVQHLNDRAKEGFNRKFERIRGTR
jgi:hypothetical protein